MFVCLYFRFGVGFCFTVVYAALMTKTNRISRIFNAGRRTVKRPNFISPKSQLVICSALISVQVGCFFLGFFFLISWKNLKYNTIVVHKKKNPSIYRRASCNSVKYWQYYQYYYILLINYYCERCTQKLIVYQYIFKAIMSKILILI